MNPVIVFIAGGDSFFVGLLLLLVTSGLSVSTSRVQKPLASISLLIASILIVVSITPIAYWWYALLAVSVVLWVFSIRFNILSEDWKRRTLRLLAFCAASGFILELPFYLQPMIPAPQNPRLVILADSLTAGLEEEDFTWPERLAEKVDYPIVDRSHVGAIAADGLEMIEGLDLDGDLVLVELGGNDLLGSTTAKDFHDSLQELLSRLSEKDCRIVMFEVPVPPFRYDIAYSQRSLCRQFDVDLIPKRYLLKVIVGENQTLDSIHLSADGHQQMSEFMRDVFRPALER